MIHLHVVLDDHVDIGRIDDIADAGQLLVPEVVFHIVDEGNLFINNQIGIVRGASLSEITMEIPEVPVDAANPVDAFT
jgi:hypothetical protein